MSDETYAADFEAFCRQGLGRVLRPYQAAPARAIIHSVVQRRGETIAILMARQSGKNELITCLAAWLLLRFPGIKIGIYAPTLPQAAEISMRRTKRHLRRVASRLAREQAAAAGASEGAAAAPAGARPAGGRGRARSGEPAPVPELRSLPLGPLPVPRPEVDRADLLEMPVPASGEGPFARRGEGAMLGAHSAEREAEKEGFTWDLILYDEAQAIERAVIDEEIAPMGSATGATEVYIGTPYCVDCKFYEAIQAVKEGRIAGACFEYSWEAVAPHVPEYARFVAKKAAELGRDSVAFRTQYGLEWVKGLGLFFDFDLFRTLALEGEEFLSTRPHPSREPSSFAVGIDLAGDDPGNTGRSDFTAVAVLRREGERKTLVDLHAWQGKDWERQFQDITRLLRALPGRVQVTIDATGMGDPVSDRLQKALADLPIPVERLKLTAQSKSEVGLYAEQEIGGGRVFYAAGPETRAQGLLDEFLHQARWLAREALPDKAVRWYVSAAKGHDDLVCAFFLAIWAARRAPVRRPDWSEVVAVSTAWFGE